MSKVTIEIPDESAKALHIAPEALKAELLMLAAVKLFELGRLSSGAAAKFAGIPRTVFLQRLGDYSVNTFDLTKEELEQEAEIMKSKRKARSPLDIPVIKGVPWPRDLSLRREDMYGDDGR